MDQNLRFFLSVPRKQIADTLDRAGSLYWVDRLRFDDIGDDGKPWSSDECPGCWHALMAGKISRVVVFLNEPHKGESRKAVTIATIMAGLQVIADTCPSHMGAILGDDDNADANTGDVLLQAATLGEVVYG